MDEDGGGSTDGGGSGGGGGGGMNGCGFRGIPPWWSTTGDGGMDVTSDWEIAGTLYSDNLSEALLGALCGVSSKMVNRSKGLGHTRRKGATRGS